MSIKYKFVECFSCGEEHDKCTTEIVDGEYICCECLNEGGGREECKDHIEKIKIRRERIRLNLPGINWAITIQSIKQNCKTI